MIKIIKDDKTLYKMVEYIKDVNDYTSGYSLETFLEDKKTQDATVKKIELIGEMVSRLSDGFKTDHNEIQWRDIKGLRNIAVHQYDRISMDEIWDIVREDIPVLNSALCNILEHEYDYIVRLTFECFQRSIEKKVSGGNFYNTLSSKLDRGLIKSLLASINSGRTAYTEAYRLTDTNSKTFAEIAKN